MNSSNPHVRMLSLMSIGLIPLLILLGLSFLNPKPPETSYETVKIKDKIVSVGVGEYFPRDFVYDRVKFGGIDGDSLVIHDVTSGYKGTDEITSNHITYQTTKEIQIPGIREEVKVKIVGKDDKSNTVVLRFIEYEERLKEYKSHNVIVKMLREGDKHDE